MTKDKQKEQDFKDKIDEILLAISANFASDELIKSVFELEWQIDTSILSRIDPEFISYLGNFLDQTAICINDLRQTYIDLVNKQDEEPWCDED